MTRKHEKGGGVRGRKRYNFKHTQPRRWNRWVVNATPWSLCPRETYPVSIAQEDVWAAGTVWTGTKNCAVRGIWIPDPPALSVSRYDYFFFPNATTCPLRLRGPVVCVCLVRRVAPGTHTPQVQIITLPNTNYAHKNITSNFSQARSTFPEDGSQRIRNMSEFLIVF